jgi:plasmid replication initiation protein
MAKKARATNGAPGKRRVRSGKDEMNLAVFPIAALSVRVPKNVKALKFQDTIHGENGKMVKRTWTVQGGSDCGLPTAGDEDVYVALMELTRQQGFADRRVNFSRYELARRLGWSPCGKTYSRIEQALTRLANVNIHASNAFWDNAKRSYVTVSFSLIQEYQLYDEKPRKGEKLRSEPPSSFFMWTERLFESFKSGYIKFLDTELYFELSSATARRLFRYLDKKFGRDHRFAIDIFKLAHEHLGISRNYRFVSQIVQQMRPALDDLLSHKYLKTWEVRERVIYFTRVPSEEYEQETVEEALDGLPFEEAALTIEVQGDERDRVEAVEAEALDALVERGITRRRAASIVRAYSPNRLGHVTDTIAYFDWLVQHNRRKFDNPAGFLISLIHEELPVSHVAPPQTEASANDAAAEIERRSRDELDYTAFVDAAVNRAVDRMGALALEERVQEKVAELRTSDRADLYRRWSAEMVRSHALLFVRKRIAGELDLPEFEEWLRSRSRQS